MKKKYTIRSNILFYKIFFMFIGEIVCFICQNLSNFPTSARYIKAFLILIRIYQIFLSVQYILKLM